MGLIFVPQILQTEQHYEHYQANAQRLCTAIFLNCLKAFCVRILLATQRGVSCESQIWTELQRPQMAPFGGEEGSQAGVVSWPHSSCRTRWRSIRATEVIPFIWLDNFGVGNLNAQACFG